MPPNSTHLTQPLDLAYFRPMKEHWRRILLDFKLNTGKSPVPKNDFPKLLKHLITELNKNPSHVRNGFWKAGIYPLCRQEVIKRLPTADNLLTDSSGNDDLSSQLSESLLQFLHNKRYGEASTEKTIRKRKVNVKPGKSVTAEDFASASTSNVTSKVRAGTSKANNNQKTTDKKVVQKKTAVVITDSDTSESDTAEDVSPASTSKVGSEVRAGTSKANDKQKTTDKKVVKKKTAVVITDSDTTSESDYSIY